MFLWNSSEFRFGAYAVSVEVTAVKGEKAVEDNMLSGTWIRVVLAGDVDANNFVNIMDVVSVASHYSATSADSDCASSCDINDDGTIDIFDICTVTIKYEQAAPRA